LTCTGYQFPREHIVPVARLRPYRINPPVDVLNNPVFLIPERPLAGILRILGPAGLPLRQKIRCHLIHTAFKRLEML
jgi:hypothetical protein